jgi:hypothetical protein
MKPDILSLGIKAGFKTAKRGYYAAWKREGLKCLLDCQRK